MSYFSIHNHTMYSFLDGYSTPKECLDMAVHAGCSGFAVTEHGNECSWAYFDKIKKDYPTIKMRYGEEFYECDDMNIKDPNSKYYHLIILARNDEGRKCINWLTTKANDGFYYRPRIDLNAVSEAFKIFPSDCIIASSACLAGHLNREKDYDKCVGIVKKYRSVFPLFYLEMQSHRNEEQAEYNRKILKLSRDTNTPFIITTDSHYSKESDEYYQNSWVQIAHDKETGLECYDDCYIQNEPQIHGIMDKQIGEDNVTKALNETNNILAITDDIDLPWQEPSLPDYPLPQGYDSLHDYITSLVNKGFVSRGITNKPKDELNIYIQRARYEMSVIEKMGFVGYFLIVREAINWCKENGIGIGVGRGSACGSLVNYCIGITDIDPVKYNLIFERFLNPERVGLPDVDTDVEDRDALIRHLQDRYGRDYVAQVMNFSYETPIVSLRDSAKILGWKYEDSEKISSKFIWPTWKECRENLTGEFDMSDPRMIKLFDLAEHFNDRVRQSSIHAGGVVIGHTPIYNYMGCSRGTNGETVVDLDKHNCEPMSLVKFDFLGLSNLTLIKNAKKELGLTNWDLDINNPAFENDKETFDLIDSCRTEAVFQMESAGMKGLIQEIKPRSLEELSDISALYRPDAKAFIPSYVEGKENPNSISYWCDDVKPILEATHGAMIYQEQMMEIVRKLGGRTYGGADKFRKGIGKKDIKLVKQEASKLCQEINLNGYSKDLANEVAGYLSSMGGYMFNKAHSIAYSVTTMQTAYLKSHYPATFFECLLNMTSDTSDISKYIVDAMSFGIKVLPPDINKSGDGFKTDGDTILFGLKSIAGLGDKVIPQLLEERSNGTFKCTTDMIQRCPFLNSQQIISLIKSGALGMNKTECMEEYLNSLVLALKKEYTPVKTVTGTIKSIYDKYGLNFDLVKDKSMRLKLLNEKKEKLFYQDQEKKKEQFVSDFSKKYMKDSFMWEFDTLSVFLSENPLSQFNNAIKPWENTNEDDYGVLMCVVVDIKTKKSHKTNVPYGALQVYDSYNHLRETMCYGSNYKEYKDVLVKGSAVVLLCKRAQDRIIVQKVKTFDEWKEKQG